MSSGSASLLLPESSLAGIAGPLGSRRFRPVVLARPRGCSLRNRTPTSTIINGNEPESLDPAIVTGVSEMRITKALFEGCCDSIPPMPGPFPGWRNAGRVSPDGTRLHLPPPHQRVWSTGEPITAHDVAYSWRRALDPATAADYAGQLFYIKNAEEFYNGKASAEQVGIRALDDNALRVELNHPLAFFLDLCCFPTLAVVPRQHIEKHGDRWITAPAAAL